MLTNDPRRCAYYQERSQNVESRFYCQLPQGYIIENMNPNRNRPQPIPIDQETCEVRSASAHFFEFHLCDSHCFLVSLRASLGQT